MMTALFLLPLAMAVLASNPSAVVVFDTQTLSKISYFQTVPGTIHGWCAPVAAMMNYLVFAFVVAYGLLKKKWMLKTVLGLSLTAGCLALLPTLIQSTTKIIPNVFGGIFLLTESLLAYLLLKQNPQAAKKTMSKGPRLDAHR